MGCGSSKQAETVAESLIQRNADVPEPKTSEKVQVEVNSRSAKEMQRFTEAEAPSFEKSIPGAESDEIGEKSDKKATELEESVATPSKLEHSDEATPEVIPSETREEELQLEASSPIPVKLEEGERAFGSLKVLEEEEFGECAVPDRAVSLVEIDEFEAENEDVALHVLLQARAALAKHAKPTADTSESVAAESKAWRSVLAKRCTSKQDRELVAHAVKSFMSSSAANEHFNAASDYLMQHERRKAQKKISHAREELKLARDVCKEPCDAASSILRLSAIMLAGVTLRLAAHAHFEPSEKSPSVDGLQKQIKCIESAPSSLLHRLMSIESVQTLSQAEIATVTAGALARSLVVPGES
ncbi:MAG: hypothetical protein MHM6MM_005121 [Cercozoa sp. M6MM]